MPGSAPSWSTLHGIAFYSELSASSQPDAQLGAGLYATRVFLVEQFFRDHEPDSIFDNGATAANTRSPLEKIRNNRTLPQVMSVSSSICWHNMG